MTHNHQILKCSFCNVVISQCRCFDKNKETRMTTCAACKEMIELARRNQKSWGNHERD